MGGRESSSDELAERTGVHGAKLATFLLILSFLTGDVSALFCFFLSGVAAVLFAFVLFFLCPLYAAAALLTLPLWGPFLAFCAACVTNLLSQIAVAFCGACWIYASFRTQRKPVLQRSEALTKQQTRVQETTSPALSRFGEMLECPITRQIMRDPVIATDGFTYERSAISAWTARSPTSPMTNLPLRGDWWCLIPNRTVKAQIAEWQEMHDGQGVQKSKGDTLRRVVKSVVSAGRSIDTLLFGRLES